MAIDAARRDKIDAALDDIHRQAIAVWELVRLHLCTCPDFEHRFRKNIQGHHPDCVRALAVRELKRIRST